MLILNKEILEEIVNHCKKEFPLEACGVFAGKGNRVEKVFSLSNVEKNSWRFLADSREQFKVFKEIENLGLEFLGIYHSHPYGSAYPSERDKELAFYPDLFYLIISFKNLDSPEIKAYKIKEEKIEEEKIFIEGD